MKKNVLKELISWNRTEVLYIDSIKGEIVSIKGGVFK